jgi:hypothetical protein
MRPSATPCIANETLRVSDRAARTRTARSSAWMTPLVPIDAARRNRTAASDIDCISAWRPALPQRGGELGFGPVGLLR